LCVDGSDEAFEAAAAALELLGRDDTIVLVVVTDAPDEGELVGSGHAGPLLTPEEFDAQSAQATADAEAMLDGARRLLGLPGAEARLLHGDPGAAICRLATELSARLIVVGSRGRGGLKRALLGSVSDHVVRKAPCSVIVARTNLDAAGE
jgi:nucleotide-binding universal stress UspA family protein